MSSPDEDEVSAFYFLDNVHVVSVGVDIGSSTAHLMFSDIHMQRQSEGLSSRFVVVEREVRWRSEVLLTPYLPGGWIDADGIADFVEGCYSAAGLNRHDVDSGAVILTGEALKRRNSRALAEAVAAGTGDFVCVTAGHHLEAMLSAHGSGSVELSETSDKAILCIDIGGGTTKLSLLRGGEVVRTAAVEVGGRMVSWNEDRSLREVNPIMALVGVDVEGLRARGRVTAEEEASFAAALVRRMLAVARRRPDEIEDELLLIGPIAEVLGDFDAITFAGGVAEYVYGRESRGFGDLGQSIGAAIGALIETGELGAPVLNPGQGIRATVVGASQSSVQVSGSTVAVSAEAVLPIRNVPVIHPQVDLSGTISSEEVATAIGAAIKTHEIEGVVALSFNFSGPPAYPRLKALADGIGAGIGADESVPAIVMLDGDVGASLGSLLASEVGLKQPVICLDNLELKPFEYVDIGRPMMPAGVFPIVIKSLLFGSPT